MPFGCTFRPRSTKRARQIVSVAANISGNFLFLLGVIEAAQGSLLSAARISPGFFFFTLQLIATPQGVSEHLSSTALKYSTYSSALALFVSSLLSDHVTLGDSLLASDSDIPPRVLWPLLLTNSSGIANSMAFTLDILKRLYATLFSKTSATTAIRPETTTSTPDSLSAMATP